MNGPATKRLAHVESHLKNGFDIGQLVHNVANQQGNPIASAMTLSRHALASAIYAWFKEHDLAATRQWCYVASKLDQKWYQMDKSTQNAGSKLLQLLKPLLSNNSTVIEWFAHYDATYDMDRVEDPETHDFWAYQAVVALRGEWERLLDRCEKVLKAPPKAELNYLTDYAFYQALAHQDVERMNEVLRQLVEPKAVRSRSKDDSGYTADLISTAPVIYAKIAWRHGFEVEVDSPYVPREWLPNEPLAQYDNHYPFLK